MRTLLKRGRWAKVQLGATGVVSTASRDGGSCAWRVKLAARFTNFIHHLSCSPLRS